MVKLTDNKGFTLTELLVIVAILGAMVALVSIGSDGLKKHRLRQASKELCADLLSLRSQAITTRNFPQSRGCGFRFNSATGATTYTIFEFKDDDSSFSYTDEDEEAMAQVKALPAGIRATLNTTEPAPIVRVFDNLGFLRTGTWSAVSSLTIVLEVSNSGLPQRCVTMTGVQIREGIYRLVSGEWKCAND